MALALRFIRQRSWRKTIALSTTPYPFSILTFDARSQGQHLQDWTADKSSVDYRKGHRNQFLKSKRNRTFVWRVWSSTLKYDLHFLPNIFKALKEAPSNPFIFCAEGQWKRGRLIRTFYRCCLQTSSYVTKRTYFKEEKSESAWSLLALARAEARDHAHLSDACSIW